MKITRSQFKLASHLALLCFAIVAFAGCASDTKQTSVGSEKPIAQTRFVEPDITPSLIGEWKVQNSREPWMKEKLNSYRYTKQTDLTFYLLFKSDGTYEEMSWDSAFTKKPSRSLEKGRYQTSGRVITLRDFKMFSRPNRRDEGKDADAISKPCTDSIGCAGEWEAHNAYIQMAKEGTQFRIVRADWKKKQFVTEPIIEPREGILFSKQSVWTKQP